MSKKKSFGASYAKVRDLIFETSEWEGLLALMIRRLNHFSVVGIKYLINYDGRATATVQVGFGQDSEMRLASVHHNKYCSPEFMIVMNRSHIVSAADVEGVLRRTMGYIPPGSRKPVVPTYNCSVDNMLMFLMDNGGEHEIGKPAISSDMIREASDRANVVLAKITESDEFRDNMRRVREDHIVDKIRECVQSFPDATAPVLKRALDEYVMHQIMDG